MRTSRLFSLLAGAALLAACGDDDGGNGPQNEAPTAGFTYTCNAMECTFTSTSTDADGTVASVSWNFDDGETGTGSPATHTYASLGAYDVVLTVTDNEGATDALTQTVTVGGPNTDPTANFTFACNDLDCEFTDGSSDPDGTIASRSWDFDDGTAPVATKNPSHAYAAAGTYDVTLTVTDDRGGTATVTKPVVVTAPTPGGPAAGFDVSCSAATCIITNTTTGANGTVVTWAWDFGNGQTSDLEDPAPVQYSVNDVTTFLITLVVTSDGVPSQASRQVSVSPAATLTCGDVACTLGIEEDATVVVTLVSHDCVAQGNAFFITAPIVELLFEDGCYAPVAPDPAASFLLNGGNAFTAGTQLAAEVRSGVAGAENPKLRVTGNFTDGWTLEFDDGFVGPGEPDFNDLTISVKATPVAP